MGFLNYFESLPDSIQKPVALLKGYAHYNLACLNALQKNKKEALVEFEKAYKYGFDNYRHILMDKELDIVRKSPKFQDILDSIRSDHDYLYILRQSNGYDHTEDSRIKFTYAEATDEDLQRIRHYFNLDSIAGEGDELSKIKNLLYWVHDVVKHDGGSENPVNKNAIDIIKTCREKDRGVNCRMMAIILNECYLAMGIKAQTITCMPKVMKGECHVINAVYSETLEKWIWMDPTFNAYITDENGTPLGVSEVRERLINDLPLIVNEEANWNNQIKYTKENYLVNYMSKNLYYLQTNLHFGYNDETGLEFTPVLLVPVKYEPTTGYAFKTSNEALYWQRPE
ncbi:MAG: transglutaminase domain-containing protein [Bacteroides sp.]|nr:transglutaminase domain-containing protein [Bacteroides sp.]